MYTTSLSMSNLQISQGYPLYSSAYGTSDQSQSGYTVLGGGDFNCNGIPDVAIAEPYDNNQAGRVYILELNPGQDQSVYLSNPSTYNLMLTVDGKTGPNYLLGKYMTWVGLPNSNCSSILIGSNTGDSFLLKYSSDLPSSINATQIGSTYSGSYIYHPKASLASATAINFNCNENQVLVYGAPTYYSGGTVYGLYMNSSMPSSINLLSIGVNYQGFIASGTSGSNAGTVVASTNNFFGDGCGSIIIGAPYYNTGTTYNPVKSGRVYVLKSNYSLQGQFQLDDVGTIYAGFKATGPSNSYSGSSVGNGGFINCGNQSSIAIGAQNTGKITVLYGNSSYPASVELANVGISVDGFYASQCSYPEFGYLSKIDGSSCGALIFGCPGSPSSGSAGVAYVVYGGNNLSNIPALNQMTPSQGFEFGGISYSNFGSSVSSAGDILNTGSEALIVGAPGQASGTGASYVLYTAESGFVTNSPTMAPTAATSHSPTTNSQTHVPTMASSASPSAFSSAAPTKFPSAIPTKLPTPAPTTAIYISSGGDYDVSGSNQNIVIDTGEDVTLYGSGSNNMFTLEPYSNGFVTVNRFNNYTDLINLKAFNVYSYDQLNITSGSIIITLDNNQIMKLLELSPGDISANNFVFSDMPSSSNDDGAASLNAGDIAGIVIAGTAFVSVIGYCASAYFNKLWPFAAVIGETAMKTAELTGSVNPMMPEA